MKNRPLVSIILPVYNVQAYLGTCLDSILGQTFQDLEIIAVNDGSTDASLSILEAYAQKDSRLHTVSQENQGLSVARNTGLNAAKGKYIFFVDSDDFIAPKLIECCVNSFEIYSTDLVVFNHANFFTELNSSTPKTKPLKAGPMAAERFLKEALNLETNSWYPVCWYAFKSEFLKSNHLKFHEGIYHEDILFTPIALSMASDITIIPEVLYYYRQRLNSITKDASNTTQKLKDHIFIAAQLFELSQKKATNTIKDSLERLVAQRYQFILEAFERQQISFGHRDYDALVKTLQKKASITRHYSSVFYQKYIETPKQKRRREFLVAICKWPRRIYKYQIKSRIK